MKNLRRYILHIPHGLIAAICLYIIPVVGAGWLITILVYQCLESREINDNSHLDLRGYLIGYFIGIVLILLGA